MLQEILLVSLFVFIAVVLIAVDVAAVRRHRALHDARWDAACEQTWSTPLEIDALVAADGAPRRSSDTSHGAVARPLDAWVDDALWHALDEL